jgi:2-haloacid dehalogenase
MDKVGVSGIKALVFDVFGTVVDWRGGVAREVARFATSQSLTVDPFEFADAWRREYVPAMAEVRAGNRGFVRLDVLHRENLNKVLTRLNIDPESLPVGSLDELNLAWHKLDPWSDAVPGLVRLKERFIIAPLSNGNIRLMLDIARRAGIPWDAILGAEVVRMYKPAPSVYLETAELLAIEPAELCMVAAHNDDLKAAKACGLRTAFVARPHEHGEGQTKDLVAQEQWDFVASSFIELADIMLQADKT